MHRRVAPASTSFARLVALAAAVAVPALLTSCSDEKPAPPEGGGPAASPAPGAAPVPADVPKLEFTDHAPALRLWPQFRGERSRQPAEDMAGGVAVADFDGDGRPDVLFVGAGTLPAGGESRLYRNETPIRGAALELKDVTKDAGLPGLLPGMGAAVADTDGDGDLDLLLTCVGAVRMLRNDGGLTFSDVTHAAGMGDVSGWCTGATFGDADGDGDLDLYVCRYLNDGGQPATNLLFRNDGQGRFEGGEALAKELGVDCAGGRSLGALFGDFDGDGVPDLCVAGESGVTLFRGTSAEGGRRGFASGQQLRAAGAVAFAACDADGDGDDDLFVASPPMGEIRWCSNLSANGSDVAFELALKEGGGVRTAGTIATLSVTTWSLDLPDFDLDGRPDLFAAGGAATEDTLDNTRLSRQRSLAFWNAGGKRGFVDAGPSWGAGWNTSRVLRGGAAADLDGDGDPDVVLGALDGAPVVLVNEGDRRGRPLSVALRAPAPNTFGVGARVTVKCDGRTWSREMRSSPGYLSAGPLVLLFGLGDAKGKATISVRWPDGTTSDNTVEATERWPVVTKSGKR
jgi:enediyne biosynthesis protein E4